MNILLLEDNSALRHTLMESLEVAGHHVIDAGDGKLGMKLCREAEVDIAIVDIFMPEMDGFEVISTLKKSFPEVGIIVMTGVSQVDKRAYLRAALRLGADMSIVKPFATTLLLEAIEEISNR